MTKECECAAHSAVECCCGAWDEPQRIWVGLTDEDLANCSGHEVRWALYWEKLLKEKNT